MSLRNRLVLSVILSAIAVLVGCGSGNSFTKPVPPPSGSFSASNLNGTYVFTVLGTDNINGAPFAIVGSFTANGQGGITSGTLDMNDAAFASSSIAPVANATISSSSYRVGVDGRGQTTLNVSTPFGNNIVLDFVLVDSSHGLVSEFDNNATGSGTLDVQTAGTTPTGSYAFGLSGGTTSGSPYAVVGNFTLGNGGALTGVEDVNDGGVNALPNQALTGSLALGPSSNPSTTLSSPAFSGVFDVYAISADHLKFIEMDQTATLAGDAYSQTSTTMPTGNLTFVLAGCGPCSASSFSPFAAGGFMVADAAGNITNASTEDYNSGGSVSTSLGTPFSANYTAGGTGRYTLSNFATFVGGSSYAAYPSSGGVLLLEIDNAGLTTGAAYPQTAGATLKASEGYGFNLSGTNLSGGGSITGFPSPVEIDNIAEFATNSGNTLTGVIDENYAPGGFPNYALALDGGTYSTPDSNGRGQLSAGTGNSNNSTLNGGFNLIYYTVDGTMFPFIEVDGGQIAAGVFVQQNPTASSSSAAVKSHMFVAPPLMKPRAALRKQK